MQPAYLMFGLHNNDFHQFMMDEIELGRRVAAWIDTENNDPLFHFGDINLWGVTRGG